MKLSVTQVESTGDIAYIYHPSTKFVTKSDYNNKLEKIKTLEAGKATLSDEITELTKKATSADDYKSQLEKLQKDIKEKEDAEKAAKAEEELTNSIVAVFGDQMFQATMSATALLLI